MIKINRIEFVKNQKTKYLIRTSEHVFQICIDCIVHNDIFWKLFFHYVLTCSVKCFICSVASCLLSSSDFVCCPHLQILESVYFQILYNTVGFYEWKLNLIWSWKWINCKRITEPTCWSLSMLLTHHVKFSMCNNRSIPVQLHTIHWQAWYNRNWHVYM